MPASIEAKKLVPLDKNGLRDEQRLLPDFDYKIHDHQKQNRRKVSAHVYIIIVRSKKHFFVACKYYLQASNLCEQIRNVRTSRIDLGAKNLMSISRLHGKRDNVARDNQKSLDV